MGALHPAPLYSERCCASRPSADHVRVLDAAREHRDGHLSAALDAIPCAGEVGRDRYDAFVRHLQDAFDGLGRGRGGIATATRLLAMKRPDYFLCLDSRNGARLRKEFGIPVPATFAQYWDSIVERVLSAPW